MKVILALLGLGLLALAALSCEEQEPATTSTSTPVASANASTSVVAAVQPDCPTDVRAFISRSLDGYSPYGQQLHIQESTLECQDVTGDGRPELVIRFLPANNLPVRIMEWRDGQWQDIPAKAGGGLGDEVWWLRPVFPDPPDGTFTVGTVPCPDQQTDDPMKPDFVPHAYWGCYEVIQYQQGYWVPIAVKRIVGTYGY